jgi:hypothetical protein
VGLETGKHGKPVGRGDLFAGGTATGQFVLLLLTLAGEAGPKYPHAFHTAWRGGWRLLKPNLGLKVWMLIVSLVVHLQPLRGANANTGCWTGDSQVRPSTLRGDDGCRSGM